MPGKKLYYAEVGEFVSRNDDDEDWHYGDPPDENNLLWMTRSGKHETLSGADDAAAELRKTYVNVRIVSQETEVVLG